MSRPETFKIKCDYPGCNKTLPGVHTDHTQANNELTEAGWYYDAHTDRCPNHWPDTPYTQEDIAQDE